MVLFLELKAKGGLNGLVKWCCNPSNPLYDGESKFRSSTLLVKKHCKL